MDRQGKQKKLFDKAKKIKIRQLKDRHTSWSTDVDRVCKEMVEDAEKTFDIERENLALEMSRIEKVREREGREFAA